jgi:hypothetical protein
MDANAIAKKHGTILNRLTWLAIILCSILGIIRCFVIFPTVLCLAPGLIPLVYILYLIFYAWFKEE